jgi:hypothetical protein
MHLRSVVTQEKNQCVEGTGSETKYKATSYANIFERITPPEKEECVLCSRKFKLTSNRILNTDFHKRLIK